MERLKTESAMGKNSSNLVLEQVKYRANWQKHQEAQKRREEEKIERERGDCLFLTYQMIQIQRRTFFEPLLFE